MWKGCGRVMEDITSEVEWCVVERVWKVLEEGGRFLEQWMKSRES